MNRKEQLSPQLMQCIIANYALPSHFGIKTHYRGEDRAAVPNRCLSHQKRVHCAGDGSLPLHIRPL